MPSHSTSIRHSAIALNIGFYNDESSEGFVRNLLIVEKSCCKLVRNLMTEYESCC